jgi:hypothetical protein
MHIHKGAIDDEHPNRAQEQKDYISTEMAPYAGSFCPDYLLDGLVARLTRDLKGEMSCSTIPSLRKSPD